MQLACSSLAFTHLPFKAAAQRISALGFQFLKLPVRGDGVWSGHLDPGALLKDPSLGNRLADDLNASGLKLMGAGCEMSSTTDLAEECKRHEALTDWLAAQGAKHLTIFVYDDPRAKRRWETLREISHDRGLVLSVETHLGTGAMNPHRAIELCEEMDLAITLDASHYVGQGYEPKDWRPLMDRVANVQVRCCVEGELQDQSEDINDIQTCLEKLIPPGWEGPVVCEQIHHDGEDWTHQMEVTREALLSL